MSTILPGTLVNMTGRGYSAAKAATFPTVLAPKRDVYLPAHNGYIRAEPEFYLWDGWQFSVAYSIDPARGNKPYFHIFFFLGERDGANHMGEVWMPLGMDIRMIRPGVPLPLKFHQSIMSGIKATHETCGFPNFTKHH